MNAMSQDKYTIKDWLLSLTWVEGPGFNPHPQDVDLKSLFTNPYTTHSCTMCKPIPGFIVPKYILGIYTDWLLPKPII